MRLDDFAAKHRLRVRRAEDGEQIIPGKFGHLYLHDDFSLGLLFMPDSPRRWSHARRKLEATGFTIWQDGDDEGSALFDPSDAAQASLALKVAGVKRKRTLTPEQRAAKTAILEKVRAARMAVSRVA